MIRFRRGSQADLKRPVVVAGNSAPPRGWVTLDRHRAMGSMEPALKDIFIDVHRWQRYATTGECTRQQAFAKRCDHWRMYPTAEPFRRGLQTHLASCLSELLCEADTRPCRRETSHQLSSGETTVLKDATSHIRKCAFNGLYAGAGAGLLGLYLTGWPKFGKSFKSQQVNHLTLVFNVHLFALAWR